MRFTIIGLAVALVGATTAGAVEPAAEVTKAAVPPLVEPVICKRTLETGSLVKKRKTCMTRKQWSSVSDASSDAVREMSDQSRFQPPGR